jgi:hypothetical protein
MTKHAKHQLNSYIIFFTTRTKRTHKDYFLKSFVQLLRLSGKKLCSLCLCGIQIDFCKYDAKLRFVTIQLLKPNNSALDNIALQTVSAYNPYLSNFP